jgi:hypothetical protein
MKEYRQWDRWSAEGRKDTLYYKYEFEVPGKHPEGDT